MKKRFMQNKTQNTNKDIWDKSNIILRGILALIALTFTLLFNFKQQENADATLKLASSNLKLSQAQLECALIPLVTNEDPKKREIAMSIAQALDENFAQAISSVMSINDPDENVRRSARMTLGSLTLSKETVIRQKAEKSIDQYDIVNELRIKGFLNELNNAQKYLEGGNPNDKEKALQIYRKIITQLSQAARSKLDQTMLINADKDYKTGYNDNAVSKYRALFNDYSPFIHD
jgi:hypothetical protein